MAPEIVGNLLIIAGVPVLIWRLFVGLTYPRRVSKLWTFGLPVLAMLVLFVRVAIQRNVEGLISPQDWVSVATWAFIVVTQFVATLYQYWPASLFRAPRSP